MKIWLKKLLVIFITVLTFGSALFPVSSFAEGQTPAGPTEQTLEQTGVVYQDNQSPLPACNILFSGVGTIEGCFVRLFYYVFLYPSAWIAGIAGQIFDYFIAYTLNSESYSSGGFVEQGWRVVRDIANASFIFVLLYAAIMLIVKSDTPSMTRTLTRVILIAVVINFSLFMTRAIIDAGNILGRVFYEKTIISNDDLGEQNKYKTISAGLIEKVAPQKLLTADVFTKKYAPTSIDTATQTNTLGGFGGNDSDNDLENVNGNENFSVGSGFMILIILVASIVNIAIAWVFVSVSIFLVARTLGLWIMMIMSPIAFASYSIPFLKIKDYGFNEWLSKTFKLSFMVVIFMFFLYLTVMFIDISFATAFNINANGGQMSTIHWIMSVIVPLMAILFLLNIAKSQAKSMSGEFGDMVGKALKVGATAVLGAGGLALGGAAAVGGTLGRQVIGKQLGGRLAKADTSTAWGRMQKRAGDRLQSSTFDARNMKIPKPIGKLAGYGRTGLSYATDGYMSANDFKLSNLGSGSQKTYEGLKKEREEKLKKRAEQYKLGESASVNDVTHTYDVEETTVDANGNVVRQKRTARAIESKISVAEAKKQKMDADRALKIKKEEAHATHNYAAKQQELEKKEGDLKKAEQQYNDLLNKKKAGQRISDAQIQTAQTNVQSEKSRVKYQKEQIKQVEDLYQAEANAVSKASALMEATQRGLHAKNTEILKDYADNIEKWSKVPDLGLTHRSAGSKSAAGKIRNMADVEEKKS